MGENAPVQTDRPLDVGKALKLRLVNHLSYQAIGDKFNVSRQAVHDALKPFCKLLEDPETVAAYRNKKAELLESVELSLVADMLDEDKRAKASLNNTAYALNTLNGIIRAERGQTATNNISISLLVGQVTPQIAQSSPTSTKLPQPDVLDIDKLESAATPSAAPAEAELGKPK